MPDEVQEYIRFPWIVVLAFLILVFVIPVGHLYLMHAATSKELKDDIKALELRKANAEEVRELKEDVKEIKESVQWIRVQLAGQSRANARWRLEPRPSLSKSDPSTLRGEGQASPGWPAHGGPR